MRSRTVVSACLAGLAASLLLSSFFTQFWPGLIAPELAGTALPLPVILFFCFIAALLLVSGGYLSAWLEWATSWQDALRHGFNSGVLAGCLVYLFSGAAAASGIMGYAEIFRSLSAPIASESAGDKLIIFAIFNTAFWVQGVFWAVFLPSLILGSFGGLLTRWVKIPARFSEPKLKRSGMERVSAYTLSLFLSFMLAVAAAAYQVMNETINKSPLYKNIPVPDSMWMQYLPLFTGAAFLVVWLILIAWWVQATFDAHAEQFKLGIWAGGVIFLALLLYWLSPPVALVSGSVFTFIMLFIWMLRKLWKPQPPTTPDYQPYSWLDLVASGLTQGIIGSALTTVILMAYTFSVILLTTGVVEYLTLQGPLKTTAQEQIEAFYSFMSSFNLIFVLISCLMGVYAAYTAQATMLVPSYQAEPVEPIDLMKFIEAEAARNAQEKQAGGENPDSSQNENKPG